MISEEGFVLEVISSLQPLIRLEELIKERIMRDPLDYALKETIILVTQLREKKVN